MTIATAHADAHRLNATIAATHAAGVWARRYVAGALDPRLANPRRRDAVAQNLTAHGRADEAAALLAGWATHRDPTPATRYPWHRLIGSTAIVVTTAQADGVNVGRHRCGACLTQVTADHVPDSPACREAAELREDSVRD